MPTVFANRLEEVKKYGCDLCHLVSLAMNDPFPLWNMGQK
jgi:hypothetical protein